MAFRNIVISNACVLTVRNNQLLISRDKQTSSVPIEDICTVVIDNSLSSITSYALAQLSAVGVSVFLCNGEHIPQSVLLPFNTFSRQLKMTQEQFSLSKPFKAGIWKQIVVAKINNQAKCLDLCEIEGAETLERLSKNVQSGDKTNMEAVAAAKYFKLLFGDSFTRRQDNVYNACLNYGYSIFRGTIARTLAAAGLEPCLGIHHRNELNNFNLADDLIEPFRPIVDLFVMLNVSSEDTLTSELKYRLIGLLSVNVMLGTENQSASYAIERMVQSYSACVQGKQKDILVPQLTDLRLHQYE